MVTIRVSDRVHKLLLRVGGTLQNRAGRQLTFDETITRLGVLGELYLEGEIGLELNNAWGRVFRSELPEHEAYLWYWGLASASKMLRDTYGFDSMACYVWSYAAKHFEDYLLTTGKNALHPELERQVLVEPGIDPEVKSFLKKCTREGTGNWVSSGVYTEREVVRYLFLIQAYHHGKWNDDDLKHLQRFLKGHDL